MNKKKDWKSKLSQCLKKHFCHKNEQDFYRKEGYSEKNLLQIALTHFYSAELLFTNPLGFFSGGFLIHLSVELALKACCLFYFDQFPRTHAIKKLLRQLENKTDIKLDTIDKEFIKRSDKLHDLRYKLDEIGTNDLNEANRLIHNIMNQMPEKMQKIFKNTYAELKKTYDKIPKRVFNDLARNNPTSN